MTVLPPLVEPAAPLTAAEVARYSRHVLLPEVGETGQRRLKAARVLVIGAGGWAPPRCSTWPRPGWARSG